MDTFFQLLTEMNNWVQAAALPLTTFVHCIFEDHFNLITLKSNSYLKMCCVAFCLLGCHLMRVFYCGY